MQVIVIGERNSFIEKKFMVELESKIQAIGYTIASSPLLRGRSARLDSQSLVDARRGGDVIDDVKVAVLVSDGRPLLAGEQKKLKTFLKNKTVVKPHKLLVIYHIADTPVPTEWSEPADFVAKELYSIIGCLKDYWFFSHSAQ